MSPFWYANKVNEPILLIHGERDEILPIEYDDNYVTVFPGETVDIHGRVPSAGTTPAWVRVTGYNNEPGVVPVG